MLLLGILLATMSAVATPGEWIGPQEAPPPILGEVVAEGQWGTTFPDLQFTATLTGVVQLESFDSDPKCRPDGTRRESHIFFFNDEPLIPPASIAPCDVEPVDNLYSYMRLDVKPGDVITGDTRQDSGRLTVRFADEQALLASLGDYVWYDENQNGVQDSNEVGVEGIQVDLFTEANVFVKSDTTDANGYYLFTELTAGGYYVEFASPQGLNFTKYNIDADRQDEADSDPLVPWLTLDVSAAGQTGVPGRPLTYTLSYSNTDTTLIATDLLISTTLPLGTTFVVTGSTPGWSCDTTATPTRCNFAIPSLAAREAGVVSLVILLDEEDDAVPNFLDLPIFLSQKTVARTQVVTLDLGEANLTVDAGVVWTSAFALTETTTRPTSLPPAQQPGEAFLFLPMLQVVE